MIDNTDDDWADDDGRDDDGPDDAPDYRSLGDEVRGLVEAAKERAQTEIAFQTARAGMLGKLAGMVAALGCVALILLFYATMAAVFGLVLALAQWLGAWAATGIVVGGLVLLALLAMLFAWTRVRKMGALIRADRPAEEPQP